MTTRAVDALAYLIVRGLVAIIQVLPLDMGDHLCRAIAVLLSGPVPIRKRTISETLTKIYPTLETRLARQLTLGMWHHLMLMVCEVAWAQRRLHRSNWTQHIRFQGNREMLAANLSPRASVIVSGHFGNFEIGSYILGLMGLKTLAIARNLDNPHLHQWVERFRAAKGQRLVDKNGCAPVVEEFMREGGTLSLLADQHAGEKGLWVHFCGIPASCHKALALFSLANDAPMMASYTRRVEGRPMQFESGLMEMVDPLARDAQGQRLAACESVESLTIWYNHQLERIIDRGPEQYWWLHRRWRTPSPRTAKRLQRRYQSSDPSTSLRAAG